MWRAEWTGGQHRMTRIGEPGDAVHRARRDGLDVVERWEDRFESSCEHRLPGPGWPDEEEVVPTRRGDLERALRRLLACDVREVDWMRWCVRARRHRSRSSFRATLQVLDHVAERREAERLDTASGRFARIRGRDQRLADSARRGVTDARHRPAHGTQRPVQRELAETERRDVHAQLPARAEDAERDRELEPGSFLAAFRGREVHRDPTERELEA